MDPVRDLLKIVVPRLRSYSAVTDIVGQRSYDEPPLNQDGEVPVTLFPYISIGPMNYQAENVDCVVGGEVTIQIDAWSIEPQRTQVMNMADAIRKAFRDYEFALTDNAVVLFEHWRTDYIVNGTVKHASVRFTAIIEEP